MRSDLGRGLPNPFGELNAAHCSRFRIGGVSVEVEGEHSDDVTLVPSLEPFRIETRVPDIKIQVEWVAKLPSAPGRELFDSGSVWRLYEDETGFQFDFSTPILGDSSYKRLFVDDQFCRASLLLSDECLAKPANTLPLDYPLDELLIMHRLTQEKAVELHSCGIARDGNGNLFVGHSGAGKSTTTRLWTACEDVEVLSDDRIIVREHSGQIFMYGTPWHGDAAFALPGRALLKRIFVLEHGLGNVLTQLNKSQAVAELFARSFVPLHRHEYVDSALRFLEYVADSIPCYRYAFEPNQGAVERILNLRD